ncbi:hypothetical protein J7J62_08980 [bacterium]|nr:hypothetical protein [bacterium]
MAEPTTLAVGLKAGELPEDVRKRLFYLSSNYECHYVDILDFISNKYGNQKRHNELTNEYMKRVSITDKYYGFAVAQTWNGVIHLDDPIIQDRVKKAKECFKKITGKEGRVLLIGEQI